MIVEKYVLAISVTKSIENIDEILILDEFESDDTKEAFINGDFYLKVHGECGWISQSGEAYRRNQSPQAGFQIDADWPRVISQ